MAPSLLIDWSLWSQEGLTPLYLAVRGGHVESVLLLINSGADVNIRDKVAGQTPLHQVHPDTSSTLHTGRILDC